MKKYDKYKDSGIEWIGEIPKHWEVVMIKRLSPVKRGASPRPIDDPKYFDGEGVYSWVRIADVSSSERYLENTTQTLSELGSALSVKREPGDFFLSIAGTVGKPIITKIKCCIHDGFVYFPDLKINPEYLYYIFSTGLPYKGLGKWGTQLNLNTDSVGEIFIPIHKEIKSIINYLDRKINEIDQLIADKKRLLELYEEEKTVIINQAVTKGINPDVAMKDSGIAWLGEIPEHWEVRRLSRCFSLIGSGTTPKAGEEIYYLEGDINWLLTGDLNDWNITTTTKKITNKAIEDYSSLKQYPENSIVIAMYGATIGKLGILNIPTTVNQACCVLANSTLFHYLFAFYLLLAARKEIINMSYGGGQPNISQELLKSFRMQVPTMEEQFSIVQHIEIECTHIDNKIRRTKKLIDLLTEYRTALISEVVTGKIKITD